jgi:hypothetical protein
MAIKDSVWVKVWIGFGVITILSGIYLAIQGDYVIGICGSAVGVWLIAMNMKNLKSTESE